jgi:hypothetical protein
VKEALTVLIQHNLARAVMPTADELQRAHPRTFVYYEVSKYMYVRLYIVAIQGGKNRARSGLLQRQSLSCCL